MKIFKTLFFVLAVSAVMTSCTNIHRSMREANVRVELQKEDFTLSGQVSGEATSTRILMIDWKRLFKSEDATLTGGSMSLSIPVIGNLVSDPTANYALAELMKANEGYDVVFYPQYITTTKRPFLGLGFIVTKSEVKVTARLGKMKD